MGYYNMMDYGGMMGYGGWWLLVGALFWILILVALILAIYWLYRNIRGSGGSAIEILRQRYARGEMSKKEFDEKMKDLGR